MSVGAIDKRKGFRLLGEVLVCGVGRVMHFDRIDVIQHLRNLTRASLWKKLSSR